MTADLVAFLHARLDEDEAVARAAAKETDRDWNATVDPDDRYTYRAFLAGDNDPFAEVSFFTAWEPAAPNIMPHIARHDPARVLADVQAKRAIIAKYERACYQADNDDEDFRDTWEEIATTLEGVLILLAQPFVDLPGFDPAWKP